jgi:hypothetical protein
MRFSTVLFLGSIMATSFCFAQEDKNSQAVTNKSSGLGNAYIVQLTEFRMKKSSDVQLSSIEILKSFDQLRDNGDIEIIETIRLSALPTYESMMQIGKKATVTVGVMNVPGRPQARQMQQEMIGTMVRLTAEPCDGKTLLKLSYEASRFEGERSNDSPPDTKTFQINTTLLLDRSKTTLVGGTSAESSTFLAVSIN